MVPDMDPAITIRRVLDHSSGLPAHARFDEMMAPEIPPGSWDAWRSIVGAAATVRRANPPGQFAVYSDIGYILLGGSYTRGGAGYFCFLYSLPSGW